MCVAGATPFEVVQQGNELLLARSAKMMKKAKFTRGVAIPVSISVNECLGNYSPLSQSPDEAPLAVGDIVKIDLGVHMNGMPVQV